MSGEMTPWAMDTPDRKLVSSLSFLSNKALKGVQKGVIFSMIYLMANCRCLGVMRVSSLSLAALPANSKISTVRYSMTAARYTGAPASTLLT